MIGCLPTQALAFLAVFVYATLATQAIAFEWKPGLSRLFVIIIAILLPACFLKGPVDLFLTFHSLFYLLLQCGLSLF